MIEIGTDVASEPGHSELKRLVELIDSSPMVRDEAGMLFANGMQALEIVDGPGGKRAQLSDPFWNLIEREGAWLS